MAGGMGSTMMACDSTCRTFLGFDNCEKYCDIANDRPAAARQSLPLKEYRAGQLPLFGGEGEGL